MDKSTKKKLDNRIRILIENNFIKNYRSFFTIVGEKSKHQVPILYHILSKTLNNQKCSVLWCYKKDIGFSTNQKKRLRLIQKKKQLGGEIKEDNLFEQFIASTKINYCYYKDTERILGNTFKVLVLQDFEALTPNILARTIETIEGGGLIILLLDTITSLKQLYTLSMDVHSRYRTGPHKTISPRFNERFLLSLAYCFSCMVIDDRLNILPISKNLYELKALPKPEDINEPTAQELELNEKQEALINKKSTYSLSCLCKTVDQLNVLVSLTNILEEKIHKTIVSLTAARGRGKSATLGLAIANAIANGFGTIYITSPSPENIKTLFEFILKGFESLNLKQHSDYELIYFSDEINSKLISRINIYKDHRQTIEYINPKEINQNRKIFSGVELVVIDEAAAIPLPIVECSFGPYLTFLASTINGYEGTGRSLSLKLLNELRNRSGEVQFKESSNLQFSDKSLVELSIDESIRYSNGDDVEKWLNHLLCLDATLVNQIELSSFPVPDDCDLYYINRDTLFSYHSVSENFLQNLVSLYTSSHYKNTPNDLQLMSDAPAHHLFCLLGPIDKNKIKKKGSIGGNLPEILCFIQVALEGEISSQIILESLSRGQRNSGDLIPWTLSEQFQDENFAKLSGARIVRIATHPKCFNKGYGSRALSLLENYYKGLYDNEVDVQINEINCLEDENVDLDTDEIKKKPKKQLPPLLQALNERKAEKLDYLGTCFGLTNDLLKFWKKNGFAPVYIRQTTNDLTGEHSCIMIKSIDDNSGSWAVDFYSDFRKRFLYLLSYEFDKFSIPLPLNVLQNQNINYGSKLKKLTKTQLEYSISLYDLKRLEKYSSNLVDYHLIVDLLPSIAKLYFNTNFCKECNLSVAQLSILICIGLQHKSVDEIVKELNLDATQVLGLFIRAIAKITKYLKKIEEDLIETNLGFKNLEVNQELNPFKQNLNEELKNLSKDTDIDLNNLKNDLANLDNHKIKKDVNWKNLLNGKSNTPYKANKRKPNNNKFNKKVVKKVKNFR